MNAKTWYIAGLSSAFALGVGIGAYFNKEINYACYKTERVIAAIDQELYNANPAPVKKVMDAQQAVMLEGLRGMSKEEAEQEKDDRIKFLEEKIKQYEQGKENQ